MIFNKAPPLINILGDRGIDNFQVEAVCKLMDDYAGIMLAYATLFGISRLRKIAVLGSNAYEVLNHGRLGGSQANTKKAKIRAGGLIDAAIFKFKEEPACTYDECVKWIKSEPSLEKCTIYGKKGKVYSDRRIKEIIKGTKDIALKT